MSKRYVVTFRGQFTIVYAESVEDAKQTALPEFAEYGATLDELEAVAETF